jgi:hypothetical protein
MLRGRTGCESRLQRRGFAYSFLGGWLMLCLCSCHTQHVGVATPDFMTAQIIVPAGMLDAQYAAWEAVITGGVAPFTVAWDFGGGAEPNTLTQTDQQDRTIAARVKMVVLSPLGNGTYNARITVTDSAGQRFVTPGKGVAYTIANFEPTPPYISSATYAAGRLTVSVVDPDDGVHIWVTVSPPDGFTVDNETKLVAATGPFDTSFAVSADDIFAGATGTFAVTASDQYGFIATYAGGVEVTIPPLALAANALYAIPLQQSAAVDAPVTVVVATGRPANPFQYMTGVGLTMPSDGNYLVDSFDIGLPDKDGNPKTPIDGIWAVMVPAAFLLGSDSFISATGIGGGFSRWDFNVTPLADHDISVVTASGALFNAQFRFSTPGVKTFGFQEFNGVKRTYYSDDQYEYAWGDISNAHAGVPNAVTVE